MTIVKWIKMTLMFIKYSDLRLSLDFTLTTHTNIIKSGNSLS